MQTKADYNVRIPIWWFILPSYLTLWTLGFRLYSFADDNGMMEAFGIDMGGASNFIMLNSGGRYIALAVIMVLGIWIFKSFGAMMAALLGRFTMDILDLVAGLRTGIIIDTIGVVQSLLMFLLSNLIAIYLLVRFYNKQTRP